MNKTAALDDSHIRRGVCDELTWDTRLVGADVDVDVSAGVVTLKGTVGSWAAHDAAQEAAHRVDGVLDVANDIEVAPAGGEGCTDPEIARAVRRALEMDTLVPHERIHTTVCDGVVTLGGLVRYWSERDDAAHCVRGLPFVRDVVNDVKVDRPSTRLRTSSVVPIRQAAVAGARAARLCRRRGRPGEARATPRFAPGRRGPSTTARQPAGEATFGRAAGGAFGT
jgi:osmotically-inducible protein OsmY